jgi:uncharacterized protein
VNDVHKDLSSDPYATNHPQVMPFWRAAEQGHFILPNCTGCERVHWYPRPFCPFCMSRRLEWKPMSGKGHVYSFTIVRKAETPYVLAYIQIEEGPFLMSNVDTDDVETVHVGQEVRVGFRKTDCGRTVPIFVPT